MTTVVVRSGNTLSGLFGAEWRKVYEANKGVIGSDPNLIHVGDRLKVPDGVKIAATAHTIEPPKPQPKDEPKADAPKDGAKDGGKTSGTGGAKGDGKPDVPPDTIPIATAGTDELAGGATNATTLAEAVSSLSTPEGAEAAPEAEAEAAGEASADDKAAATSDTPEVDYIPDTAYHVDSEGNLENVDQTAAYYMEAAAYQYYGDQGSSYYLDYNKAYETGMLPDIAFS